MVSFIEYAIRHREIGGMLSLWFSESWKTLGYRNGSRSLGIKLYYSHILHYSLLNFRGILLLCRGRDKSQSLSLARIVSESLKELFLNFL